MKPCLKRAGGYLGVKRMRSSDYHSVNLTAINKLTPIIKNSSSWKLAFSVGQPGRVYIADGSKP